MDDTHPFNTETWGAEYMDIVYWYDVLAHSPDNFQDAVPKYTCMELDDGAYFDDSCHSWDSINTPNMGCTDENDSSGEE